MRNLTTAAVLLLLTASCASTHKAVQLNEKIEKTSEVSAGGVIGVKDGNMVYQRKVLMSEYLRELQIETYTLESLLYGGIRYGSAYSRPHGKIDDLRDCLNELALPENGGNGKAKWVEPRDYVIAEEELHGIGLNDKNKLIGMEEEFLKDRIQRFRQYKDVLLKREASMVDKLGACRVELKAAKQNKAMERVASEQEE